MQNENKCLDNWSMKPNWTEDDLKSVVYESMWVGYIVILFLSTILFSICWFIYLNWRS